MPVLINSMRFPASAVTYDSVVTGHAPDCRWKLDETTGTTAVAVSGSNGSYVTGPTLGATGLVNDGGTAVTTTAGTDYIDLPKPTGLTTGPMSVVVWFKFTTGGAGDIVWRDLTGSGGYNVILSGTNPVVTIRSSTHTVTAITSASLKTGKHRMTVTWDNTTVVLLIDGFQVDSWTVSGANTWNSVLRLGRNGTLSQFQGFTYDDVQFYTRVLTPTEDAAQYAAA